MSSSLWNPPPPEASSPTPAEVDDTEAALRYIRDWCPDSVKDYVATLASQLSDSEASRREAEASLAEAKERMRELEAQRDDYLNREWVAEKAKRKSESQLAEATRRVAEVEGLVGKWRECAEDNAARGELIQAGKAVAYTDCADQLEAILTKKE